MTVLHRVLFSDTSSGVFRFADFARVRTSLGNMIEPFQTLCQRGLGASGSLLDFDATDEATRIDAIEYVEQGRWNVALSGGDQNGIWMGGVTNRVGN